MVIVKNIREFTVAISRHLEENNWVFSSSFCNHRKVMTLMFQIKVHGNPFYLNILPGNKDPFKCSLFMDGKEEFSFETSPYKDFEKDLDSLAVKLKSCVGIE